MTGNYTKELDAVKKDLETLKTDFAKLTDTVSTDAKANARGLRDKTVERLEEARTNAVEAGTKGHDKAKQAIRKSPIAGIATTAGLGLIAGALLARR